MKFKNDRQRKAVMSKLNGMDSSVGMSFNSEKELNDNMQGKTPKKSEAYNSYILGAISDDGYDEKVGVGDKGKLQFLYDRFRDEYYDGNQSAQSMGQQKAFSEWISGLPSSFNIEYQNYEILKLAKEKGTLPENATEKQEDRVLENYWNYMTVKTFRLFKK